MRWKKRPKEEKIYYKMLYLHFVFRFSQSIVRNHVGKLEFKQTKTDFSEKGLALKRLKFQKYLILISFTILLFSLLIFLMICTKLFLIII